MAKLTKLFTILCTIHLIYLFENTTAIDFHCNQNYTTSDGKKCYYCPPGTHRSGDCERSGESSICKACDKDHYQSNCTIASSCAPCSPKCKGPYTIKVKACSLYEDIQCRCLDGKYWHRETDHDGVCLQHSTCTVGEGLVAVGNHLENTKCEPCIDGQTYSSEDSFERCKRCTKCNFYNKQCTTVSDAVCATSGTTKTSLEVTETSNHTEGDKTGVIVGVIVPVVVILCGCLIIFIKRRKIRNGFCIQDSEVGTRKTVKTKDLVNTDELKNGSANGHCSNGKQATETGGQIPPETETKDPSKKAAIHKPNTYSSENEVKEDSRSVTSENEGSGNLITQPTDSKIRLENGLSTQYKTSGASTKNGNEVSIETIESSMNSTSNLHAMETGCPQPEEHKMEYLK